MRGRSWTEIPNPRASDPRWGFRAPTRPRFPKRPPTVRLLGIRGPRRAPIRNPPPGPSVLGISNHIRPAPGRPPQARPDPPGRSAHRSPGRRRGQARRPGGVPSRTGPPAPARPATMVAGPLPPRRRGQQRPNDRTGSVDGSRQPHGGGAGGRPPSKRPSAPGPGRPGAAERGPYPPRGSAPARKARACRLEGGRPPAPTYLPAPSRARSISPPHCSSSHGSHTSFMVARASASGTPCTSVRYMYTKADARMLAKQWT